MTDENENKENPLDQILRMSHDEKIHRTTELLAAIIDAEILFAVAEGKLEAEYLADTSFKLGAAWGVLLATARVHEVREKAQEKTKNN